MGNAMVCVLDDVVKQMVLGHDVECCTGLAAGFDKDAEAVEGLLDLGFGFVEIGENPLCHSEGDDELSQLLML